MRRGVEARPTFHPACAVPPPRSSRVQRTDCLWMLLKFEESFLNLVRVVFRLVRVDTERAVKLVLSIQPRLNMLLCKVVRLAVDVDCAVETGWIVLGHVFFEVFGRKLGHLEARAAEGKCVCVCVWGGERGRRLTSSMGEPSWRQSGDARACQPMCRRLETTTNKKTNRLQT